MLKSKHCVWQMMVLVKYSLVYTRKQANIMGSAIVFTFFFFFFPHKYISPTFKRHQIRNTKILFCIGMDSDVFKLLAVFDFFSDILKSRITLMGRGQKSCISKKWEPAYTKHKIEHRWYQTLFSFSILNGRKHFPV